MVFYAIVKTSKSMNRPDVFRVLPKKVKSQLNLPRPYRLLPLTYRTEFHFAMVTTWKTAPNIMNKFPQPVSKTL